MPLGLFHFQVLYNVLESIHFIHDEGALAQTVLDTVSQALNAEAGSIFKVMPNQQALNPLAAYGTPIEKLRNAKFVMGKGVVGWVAEYSQPLKVDKPQQDARFMGLVDSTTGFKTKSILAAPILSKGKCIGVIEFINRKDGPFAAPDLELVSMIGREVGIAFENARLFQNLERSWALQEALLNSLSAGVLVIDTEGNLLKMNPSGQRILSVGFVENQEEHVLFEKLIAPYPALIAVIKEVMAADAPITRKEVDVMIAEKKQLIGYSGVPIKNQAGVRLGSALLFQNITGFVSTIPSQSKIKAAAPAS